MMIYDLALVQASDLAHFAFENQNRRARLIWPNAQLPQRPSPNHAFATLTSVLARSVQVIRFLILFRFGQQARSALRDMIEIADLLLVILHDQDVYKHYITSFDDINQETEHWRTKLTHGQMRKRLEVIDEDIGSKRFARKLPTTFRKQTYQFLSTFSHVSFVSHFVSSMVSDDIRSDHEGTGEEPVTITSFVGRASSMERDTLRTAVSYLLVLFVYLDEMLWSKHGWKRFRGQRSRSWYRHRTQVLHVLVADAAAKSL
jgi:hypothetical protein